ncbi:putative LRR containing protein, partial [Trachipleistophora hominis]
VNVSSNHVVIVNENSQSVAIIFSEIDFDLSKIKKLKNLNLIVKKKGLINIQFPDLSHVKTLEVSFGKNGKIFNLLLSKYTNAKKLILYNTVLIT